KYIEDVGDYYYVHGCKCFDACEETAFKAAVSESNWPAGGFFYGTHCPRAQKLGIDCKEFYRNNALTLEVSFAQLGYDMVQEEPAMS
ncbi:degenerin unc-8, partial [Aphelenchoides avenae]